MSKPDAAKARRQASATAGAGAVAAGRGLVGIGQIVALAQLMTQVAGPFQSIADRYAQIIGGRRQMLGLSSLLTPPTPLMPLTPLAAAPKPSAPASAAVLMPVMPATSISGAVAA